MLSRVLYSFRMLYIQIGSAYGVLTNYELISRAHPGELTWLIKKVRAYHHVGYGISNIQRSFIKHFHIVGSTPLDNIFNISNKLVQHVIR